MGVLAFITLQKWICISRPFDAAIISSKLRITTYLIVTGSMLLFIYSPNIAYKIKWTGADKTKNTSLYYSNMKYTRTAGDCVSIPTDYSTNTIMTVMVYVDFIVASLLPF